MGSLHKNIQLMLEFLKGPFLVPRFPTGAENVRGSSKFGGCGGVWEGGGEGGVGWEWGT